MSILKNREGKAFLGVVVLLSIVLFAVGVWAVNTMKDKDTKALSQLSSDYQRLEKSYSDEIAKIDEAKLYYPNPDSVRQILSMNLDAIRKEKDFINNNGSSAIKKFDDLAGKKNTYTKALEDVTMLRDDYTMRTVSDLKQEIERIKKLLDEMKSKNASLSRQLANMIKKFKGAEKEVLALKEQKIKMDRLTGEMAAVRQSLDSANSDRDRLKTLLTQTEDMYRKQKEEVERLKGLTARAYNFKATYEFKDREVLLDDKGKHKNQISKEIDITFEVGESLFDETDDSRLVYLTLMKDNKPFQIIKQAIRVEKNNSAKYKMKLDKKLADGNYALVLTYREKPIIADYKFRIR